MKERLHLAIPTPCHENWNNMTSSEQGRFCQSCCKTVVDFSTMSDREVMDYVLHHAHGDTCGHVNQSQLNRLIQRPPERKTSWKYFWSLALSSLLISYRSIAQVKQPAVKSVAVPADKNRQEDVLVMGKMLPRVTVADDGTMSELLELVKGRVIDEDGQPVPFATIKLKNPSITVAADAEGWYSFHVTNISKTEITISAVGYELLVSKKLHVSSFDSRNSPVTGQLDDMILKRDTRQLDGVMVIAYPTRRCNTVTGATSTVAGGMSSKVQTYTVIDRLKDSIAGITGKRDIKIFPNPAPANGSFDVQFNVKQPGEYNVQFIDASGKIIAGKQLMIAAPGQVETFSAGSLKGHGMYFLRVVGKKDGKMYTAKMEVL